METLTEQQYLQPAGEPVTQTRSDGSRDDNNAPAPAAAAVDDDDDDDDPFFGMS